MMIQFKRVPIKFSKHLPKALEERISQKWSYALDTEKRMREKPLILAIAQFTVPKIKEYMSKYSKRFRVKNWALQILDENLVNIDENSQLIWTSIVQAREQAEKMALAKISQKKLKKKGKGLHIDDADLALKQDRIDISDTKVPDTTVATEELSFTQDAPDQAEIQIIDNTTLDVLTEDITNGYPDD